MHDFLYKDGELFCEDVRIRDIAQAVGTPVYVYSYKTLVSHYVRFEQAVGDMDHLICFAYKANSNRAIIRVLTRCGAGADCVSEGELRAALESGVPCSRIVYNGNGKTCDELRYAVANDILMINADSQEELSILNDIAGLLKKRARVALRVNPDIDPRTHPHIATGLRDSKFGFSPAQAEAAYKNLAQYRNLYTGGIHMHIGSQILELGPFIEALEKLADVAQRLRKSGINFEYCNVGGGLGIPYREEDTPTLKAYGKAVVPLVRHIAPRIICEPGRVLVGNAGILVSKVLYVKETESRKFVVLDAGMGDFFRPALYQAYHDIKPVAEPQKGAQEITADVVGPVCESGDTFGTGRVMPLMRRGDYAAIFGAGAYGYSMSSNYNLRRRAAEVLVCGKQFHLIREREQYEHMRMNEIVPPFLEDSRE